MLLPPSGKAAIVTTIHIETSKAAVTGPAEWVVIFRSSDGTCSMEDPATFRYIEQFNPPGIGETTLPYDLPGVALPAGTALCVRNSDPANLNFFVSARGYAVASNAVPAN